MSQNRPHSDYTHVIFDLDRTLWDFDRCCFETLEELYHEYELIEHGVFSLEAFQQTYMKYNNQLWALYDEGKMSKQELRKKRFKLTLEELGARNVLFTDKLEDHFLELCPRKRHLTPYAKEILEYLKGNYHLSILTNGFKEIQHTKLRSGGIDHYFSHMVTSECAGYKKPQVEIYHYTVEQIGARVSDCLFVGDSLLTDIPGAARARMDHVFYNPEKHVHEHRVTHEVHRLDELQGIL